RDERALAQSDRNDRPFQFLLGTLQPRVIVPFGRYARQGLANICVNCQVKPVRHFSRGWGYDTADAFGAELAEICRTSSSARHFSAGPVAMVIPSHPPKHAARAEVEHRDTHFSDALIAPDSFC